jgi:hypothetical protein
MAASAVAIQVVEVVDPPSPTSSLQFAAVDAELVIVDVPL